MERFQTVLGPLVKHQTVLGYSALSLLAAGGEQLFSQVVFRCPCNAWSFSYSAVSLLVPALVLLLLGFLLSARTWRLLTGCCASDPALRPRRCRWRIFGLLAAGASVAPLTWIAVALLHAAYFECLATAEWPSGHFLWQRTRLCPETDQACVRELHLLPCAQYTEVPRGQAEDVLRYLRAESQVLGWSLIACVMSLALVCTCISRCRSPVSVLQLKFWKIYLQKEKEEFERKAKEHAAKLAERNVQSFFESTTPEPFHTPSNEEWQHISSVYAFNSKSQYYSMVHKYVESHPPSLSIRSADGDGFPSALQFVDGSHLEDAAV